MVVQFDRLVERYDFDSAVTGPGSSNTILYRFVLPKPYFQASSAVSASQMPSENEADPYEKRNRLVLEAILVHEASSRKSRGTKATLTTP